MSNRKAWQLIIFGPLCGLLPIVVSVIGSVFGSNIGQVLHWFTLFTFPVGLIVALIGVFGILRNATKSQGDGGNNSKLGVLGFFFSLWMVLILANTCFRLFFLNQGGGILYVFELMPLGFTFWLTMEAWKLVKNGGETFHQLFKAQLIVSAVIFVGGIPAILNFESLLIAGETEIDSIFNVGSAITSLVPVVASMVSALFMLWVKKFQKAA
jgi:hypothetical protein